MTVIQDLEKELGKKSLPSFRVGDTVRVDMKIREGDKERVQSFTGVVIARRGGGTRETFTVRRVSSGEGGERTFPLHSPLLEGIEVSRRGIVRRAKLYYLRKKVGKAARLVEERQPRVAKKSVTEGKDVPEAGDPGEAEASREGEETGKE